MSRTRLRALLGNLSTLWLRANQSVGSILGQTIHVIARAPSPVRWLLLQAIAGAAGMPSVRLEFVEATAAGYLHTSPAPTTQPTP